VTDGFRLDGKVALVTGSAQGIGRGVAIGLAEAGASVAVLDRPEQTALGNEAVGEIESLGRKARFYPFDVTHVAQIPATVEAIVADFGTLDILVNNAGTSDYMSALECTPEMWDAILALNLKSVFFFAQAAAKHMMTSGGGKIINMGSTHALVATGTAVSYKASKGGVHSLTRELAYEWVKFGINVNAVAPRTGRDAAHPASRPRARPDRCRLKGRHRAPSPARPAAAPRRDRRPGRLLGKLRRRRGRRARAGRRRRTNDLLAREVRRAAVHRDVQGAA
jgi:2-dehydro-3-deoxy-D-gluconate 5-dehydrogenase